MKRIIYDYKNPHIVGRTKGSIKIGRLVAGILIVALVVALVYVLFFRKSGYRREAKEYFVAVAGRYLSEADADRSAAELRRKGGGGYVIGDNGYAVIVAAYETRDDAVKVANRYGYDVEGTGNYTIWGDENDEELVKICTLPERIFSALNKVADELDRGNLSSEAASFAVEEAIEQVKSAREELLASGANGELARSALNMTDKLGSVLKESSKINLRYCLIDIAFLYKNFLIYIS